MSSGPIKKEDSLSIRDNRTGQEFKVPISNGTVNAMQFRKMKKDKDDFGIMSYDPGFLNTATVKSTISYIDGDKGILEYRGIPIEQLAERASFIEVAYLLIKGHLPDKAQLENWNSKIMHHTFVHEDLKNIIKGFRYDAHPMGILISSINALGTFYPEANPALQGNSLYEVEEMRFKQIFRIIGKLPTIAAAAYRVRIGRALNDPPQNLSYIESFLFMMDHLSGQSYVPNPKISRALEVLFILHADHELNCSTAAMRHLASAKSDPYTCVSGAAGALYGPLHGGANEAVIHMLEKIETKANVPGFIEDVKNHKQKLMGFGHRIYKNYDPRAKIIRKIAYDVFEVVGLDPLVEIATELERIALSDPYFIERKLYPNVDFYSGLIYKALGFPLDMFPVLFAIPRAVGWLAHWIEQLDDKDQKIARPRQVYLGEREKNYIDMVSRSENGIPSDIPIYSSNSGLSSRMAPKL